MNIRAGNMVEENRQLSSKVKMEVIKNNIPYFQNKHQETPTFRKMMWHSYRENIEFTSFWQN